MLKNRFATGSRPQSKSDAERQQQSRAHSFANWVRIFEFDHLFNIAVGSIDNLERKKRDHIIYHDLRKF